MTNHQIHPAHGLLPEVELDGADVEPHPFMVDHSTGLP
jgi:hypothetical protein